MYITRQELAEIIREAQAKGELTSKLYNAISKITKGFLARYPSIRETDDIIQTVAIAVAKRLPTLDPEQNCFAYVSQCAFNEVRQAVRSWKRELQAKERLAESVRHRVRYWRNGSE